MASLVEHFDVLSENRLEIIPLHEGSKNPIFKKWQTSYSQSNSRSYIEHHPECNLGIRLGTILDVEGDSDHANRTIIDMIGDFPHPSYSSRKSVHHLFLNPFANLTRVVFQNMEFRGKRHQSVLPPSSVSNTSYKWLTIDFPVPPLPNRLLLFLNRIQRNRKHDVKPGHLKVTCAACREICYLHKHRFALEIASFKNMGMLWTCHACRPVDMRSFCRKLNRKSIDTTY
jgi:hypothetical protein